MTTITIPEKIIKNEELIAIPRREYEQLLRFWNQTVIISNKEKSEIKEGLREIENGKFFTLKNAKRKLGLSFKPQGR